MATLRIATRKSPLALWQSRHVQASLQQLDSQLNIELVEMTTQGDKILDTPLAKIGGKGLFVKELETGLLEKRVDLAVHSMKDVPVELPTGLKLAIMMQRENPYDAFVSNQYNHLMGLPPGAIVGTASLRRQSQLLAIRPDLRIRPLRGNVGTRLNKLDQGEFDAIVLAAAGLRRLGLANRICELLPINLMLPGIGQGAIGIECRSDDMVVQSLIAPLNDFLTQQQIVAERAINQRLSGGCQVPIAGFATIHRHTLTIRGLVAHPQGQPVLRSIQSGEIAQAEQLGIQVAEDLLAQGAGELLRSLLVV